MKTISLNGKDFSLKYTLRAFFVFESISGYPFQFGKLLDEYILFYSFLIASNKDSFNMEFDEFIELCENDLTLFEQFKEFILDEIKLRSQSAGNDVKKKKVTTRKRKQSVFANSIRVLSVRAGSLPITSSIKWTLSRLNRL